MILSKFLALGEISLETPKKIPVILKQGEHHLEQRGRYVIVALKGLDHE